VELAIFFLMGTVLLGKEACGTHDDEEEDAENKRGGAPHPRSKHAQDGHWVNRRKKLLQATSIDDVNILLYSRIISALVKEVAVRLCNWRAIVFRKNRHRFGILPSFTLLNGVQRTLHSFFPAALSRLAKFFRL